VALGHIGGLGRSSGTTPYTISGTVTYNGNGLASVALNDLPGSPITNALGQYAATVNSGWGGTGTPSKAGYSFTPSHHDYADVSADQTGRNYTASASSSESDPSAEEDGGGGGGGCFIASAGNGSSALKAAGLRLNALLFMIMFLSWCVFKQEEAFKVGKTYQRNKIREEKTMKIGLQQ